jgi:hypothetical protein
VTGEQHADTVRRADQADAIREAITRLIWQDRLEVPHAVKAEAALNALLAENQHLREVLEQLLAVRLDETPGRDPWRVYNEARIAMREIAREALRRDSEEKT